MSAINLFFAFLAGLGIFIMASAFSRRRATGRLKQGLGDEPGDNLTLSDFKVPFVQRVLAGPLADLGAHLSRDDPADLEERLRRSGWRYQSVGDYFGSKVLGAIVLFVLAVFACLVFRVPTVVTVVAAAAAGLVGLFTPDSEIAKATERRRQALYREMAWTLDRLAVVLETGEGLDSALGVLTWVSKGRGGLFMALLRDLGGALATRKTDVAGILGGLQRRLPRMAELDEFLQLVHIGLTEVQSIAPQLHGLGSYMRDELVNDVEARRQAAEMKVMLIMAVLVLPALLLIVGGPAVIGFLRVL